MPDWESLVRGSMAGGSSSSSDVGRLTTSAVPPAGLAARTTPSTPATQAAETDTDTDHALNSIKDILGGSSGSSLSHPHADAQVNSSAVIANSQHSSSAPASTNGADEAAKALQAAAAHVSSLHAPPASSASPAASSYLNESEHADLSGSEKQSDSDEGSKETAEGAALIANGTMQSISPPESAGAAGQPSAAAASGDSAVSAPTASASADGDGEGAAASSAAGVVLPTVYAGIYLSRPEENGSGLHWLMQRLPGAHTAPAAAPTPAYAAAGSAADSDLQRLPTLTAATQAATAALSAQNRIDPLDAVARRLVREVRTAHGSLPLAATLPPSQPKKRKRGRPRKHPLPADKVPVVTANDLELDEPCDRYLERFRRALRGQRDLPASAQCPEYVPEQDAEYEQVRHSALNEANKALHSATAAAAKEAIAVAGSLSAWTADVLLVGSPSEEEEQPAPTEAQADAQQPLTGAGISTAHTPALESQGMTVELGGGATPVAAANGTRPRSPMQPAAAVDEPQQETSGTFAMSSAPGGGRWWERGGLLSPALSPAQRVAWLMPANPRLVNPRFASAVTGVDAQRINVRPLRYTQKDVKRRKLLRRQLDCAAALDTAAADRVSSDSTAAHTRAAYTQTAKHLVADARHHTSACLLPLNLHMAALPRRAATPHYERKAPVSAVQPLAQDDSPEELSQPSGASAPRFAQLSGNTAAAPGAAGDADAAGARAGTASPPRARGVKRGRSWSSSQPQPGNDRAHDGPVISAQQMAALYVPPNTSGPARPSSAAAAAAAAAAWRRSMSLQDGEGGAKGDRGAHYARLGMMRAAKQRGLPAGPMRMLLPPSTTDRSVKIQGLDSVAFSTTVPAVGTTTASGAGGGTFAPSALQSASHHVESEHPRPVSAVPSAGEPSSLRGSSGVSPSTGEGGAGAGAEGGDSSLLPERVPRHIAQEADRSAAYAVALANSSRRKLRPKRVFVHSMAVSELDVKVELDEAGNEIVHFSVPQDYLNVKDEPSSRNRLSKTAIVALKSWMMQPENWRSPYPDDRTRRQLADQLGLNETQVANWFRNERKRIWLPMKRRALAAVQQARAGGASGN